jgi:hypothetical protein
VLTPEEGRVLASDIFNREFAKLGADWTKRPITLTLAGIQTQGVARENVAEPVEKAAEHRLALLKDARFLLSLREELVAEEQRLAERRMALAREYLAGTDEDSATTGRDDA